MHRFVFMLAVLALLGACGAEPTDPLADCLGGKCDGSDVDGGTDGAVEQAELCVANPGSFPDAWNVGASCGSEPTVQVHQYDANTFILRQSLCTSFEAPFMYLLFGDDAALLQDTGDASGSPAGIATAVEATIAQWLADNGRTSIPLIVVNSHAHGDHVGHNADLDALGATVVGFTADEVSTFFDIDAWPLGQGTFDLGARVLNILPIPGHESNHTAIYDHGAGLLLTGDTLYPGRLYVNNFPAYQASLGRLKAFAADVPVCHVLGTHIEMTAVPGVDFDFGVAEHDNERELRLGVEHLIELADSVEAMTSPARQVHDDFIIYPL